MSVNLIAEYTPLHGNKSHRDHNHRSLWTGIQVWAIGQALAAKNFIDMFLSCKNPISDVLPESASIDGEASRSPGQESCWNSFILKDLGPGFMCPSTSKLLLLVHVARCLSLDLGKRLHDRILIWQETSTIGLNTAQSTAQTIRPLLAQARMVIAQRRFVISDIHAVLMSVVSAGLSGEYQDYSSAEQVAMAITTAVHDLQTLNALTDTQLFDSNKVTEQLLATVENASDYRPNTLIPLLKNLWSIMR